MVTINSQELKRAFSDSTKSQLVEQPNQIDNRIVIPTIDITPRNHAVVNLVKHGNASNATSSTVFTTDTKKETYVTAAVLSVTKDATATSTVTTIQVIPESTNVAANLLHITGLTLTAQSDCMSLSFNPPIKLAKGSNVTITNSTNVANVNARATIVGYEVDPL